MKVFNGVPPHPFYKAVITQGTFDGVHAGHKLIIQRLKEIANSIGGTTVLMTFYPHPRHVLHTHTKELKLLSTIEEKITLLEEAGLDNLVLIPFTEEFAQSKPEDFVEDMLVKKLGLHTLVVGYDHRFGKNRTGDYTLLESLSKKHGFGLQQISKHELEEFTISSTNIRKSLQEGELQTAIKLLGRPYLLKGTVVKGMQLGTKIGFPTANVLVENPKKLIPQNGVYAAIVQIKDKKFDAMVNIGNNPTILSKGFSIEANIFNFAENIYNLTIDVNLVAKLREEIKFDSLDALKAQLNIDKENAQKILQTIPS